MGGNSSIKSNIQKSITSPNRKFLERMIFIEITTVIFDLDNTLLNRREAFKSYTDKFISRFVEIPDGQDKNKLIEYIIKADMDGYRKKKELYEELRTSLIMKRSDTSLEELLEFWFSEFSKSSVLMRDALETLQYLKSRQLKLGIITNGSTRAQNAKLDQVNIRHFFDSIIISDEVGVKKPDKKIFELSLGALNTTTSDALYIGDQPTNDIIGAENAGLEAVWLRGFAEWNIDECIPRYSINVLSELIDIIESNS